MEKVMFHSSQKSLSKLEHIYALAKTRIHEGDVATYIPALAEKDPEVFSIVMLDAQHNKLVLGEVQEMFTLQSVVKIINFLVAANHHGLDRMLQFVDLEPTGDPYNSIARMEGKKTKPFNPMINAGAITVASLLPGEQAAQKVQSVVAYLENLLKREVSIDQQTYESEYESADQNRAIAYMLKKNGYLTCDIETALQTYLQLCSITVNVEDLAKIALSFSAQHTPLNTHIQKKYYRIARALMMTCGMYDASGKFAAFVGIPAKSGVSGAIIAVVNRGEIEHLSGAVGIGIYGPSIDAIGNSVAGTYFLEQLVEQYEITVY